MKKEVGVAFDPTTVGKKDNIAESVLRRSNAMMLDRYTPLCVYDDGNCCFCAVALALFGTGATKCRAGSAYTECIVLMQDEVAKAINRPVSVCVLASHETTYSTHSIKSGSCLGCHCTACINT